MKTKIKKKRLKVAKGKKRDTLHTDKQKYHDDMWERHRENLKLTKEEQHFSRDLFAKIFS